MPDNFYQTYHYFIYIKQYLHDSIYLYHLLDSAFYIHLSKIFSILNRLQRKSGFPVFDYYKEVDPDTSFSDEGSGEDIQNMVSDDLGYSRGALRLLYEDGGDTCGYYFNHEDGKYAGMYCIDVDGFTVHRSLPDYINTIFSAPEHHILLSAFRAYVKENNICVDDGLEYGHVSDGAISLPKEVIGWLDEYDDEDDPDAGWIHSIPW